MQIQYRRFDFPPAKDTGPRTSSTTVVFDLPVQAATACLTGFTAEYSDNDAHEFGKLTVELSSSIDKNTVTVTATYGLRDSGESYDQEYSGSISCAVIAQL